MRFARIAAVLIAASPIMSTGPSSASSPDFDFGSNVSDDAFVVEGRGSSKTNASNAGNLGRREPQFVYTRVPACPGNAAGEENMDVGCTEADALCPADGEVMYWLFLSPDTAPRIWTFAGQRCQGRAEQVGEPIFPGFTQADFQRLPLPAGKASVQPSNGYTLVNVPTNVYAEADPVTLDTELLGFPVQVRATPSQYSWDFGDGSTVGPTSEPGAPYPDLTITHEYAEAGKFGVTLTTYYTGEYSVAGGPWLPIDGEAQVASPSIRVEALAGRNELVADGTTG